MRLRDVVNKLVNVSDISIEGLCDEYCEGLEQLKKEDWYREARDRKVRGISVYINGHMEPELYIDIDPQ